MRLVKLLGGSVALIKVGKLIASNPAELLPGVYPR